MLQSTGSQRVGHGWVTEQQQAWRAYSKGTVGYSRLFSGRSIHELTLKSQIQPIETKKC